MADSGYRSFYGQDWPPVSDGNGGLIPITKEFAGLVIGKKWRFFKEQQGVTFDVEPWEAMLESAKSLLPGIYAIVSPWTEEHFHDWCMCPKGVVTIGCASCGKAQPLDARIYTPTGFTTFGEVKVGDTVLTQTGVSVVRKVHDIREYPEYELRFSDGTSCKCADSHLWNVFPRRKVSVPRLMEAKDIPGKSRFYIETCRPTSFEKSEVPMDPYVLGVLIGDGCLGGVCGKAPLSFTNVDDDVISAVGSALLPGYELHRVIGKPAYRIVNTICTRRNAYISALRVLGLWGKVHCGKFVPDVYKYNSVEIRQQVLAGLLDTDGYVNARGTVSFTSVSKQLADDVAWLVRSLGGTAIQTVKKTGYRKNGVFIPCNDAHNVFIHIPDPSPLFKCRRKLDRVHVGARENKGRRYIEEVVATGRRVPMRCITIEDPAGLYLTDDFTVTHNSFDYGNILVLDWVVDPFDTVALIGSTTKEALKSRIWNFVQQCHAALKKNPQGMPVPGKISKAGYSLTNIDDGDSPESVGDKAGIQGRALNEDGNLQGAHAKFVRLVVDELATIRNHEAITTAMTNLRTGALDFRFAALANPESWEDPSCSYIMPPGGIKSVSPDTGFWTSTRGYWVRHHDGLKAPTLKSDEDARKYPFLMNQSTIDDNLTDCMGNWDAPQMWKMVRGFPMTHAVAAPVVLDPVIAEQNHVADKPVVYGPPLAVAAGIDPAWSDGGDGAVYQRVLLREMQGRIILDFTNGRHELEIKASSGIPVAQQLVDQVRVIMQKPGDYCAELSATAVDASANQGLADDLDMLIGQGRVTCVHVNNSMRASDRPIRFISQGQVDANGKEKKPELCRDRYQDRGTEAWCILAEFAKAGQVRGLPENALRQLTSRRFALITKKINGTEVTSGVRFPLQLEKKEEFKARTRVKKDGSSKNGSPDDCDACALAALAVKEVLGLLPYGWLQPAQAPLVGSGATPQGVVQTLPRFDNPNPGAYNTANDSPEGYYDVAEGSTLW